MYLHKMYVTASEYTVHNTNMALQSRSYQYLDRLCYKVERRKWKLIYSELNNPGSRSELFSITQSSAQKES